MNHATETSLMFRSTEEIKHGGRFVRGDRGVPRNDT